MKEGRIKKEGEKIRKNHLVESTALKVCNNYIIPTACMS